MKVYFCNSFLESCYYVRSMVPLIAGGWDGDRTSLLAQRIEDTKKAKAILDADVVVFHRPNDWRSLEVATKLREQGKKIVADNDDTYKNLEGLNLQKALEKVDRGLDKFCEFADMVTTSTEILAEEYRKLNKNVVVLPNCVDPNDWPDEPQRNEGTKVRLGFVGSVASNSDYDSIKDVLAELSKRDDVQIVVFGLPPEPKKGDTEGLIVKEMYQKDYDFWKSLNIEWQPFVPVADYIDTLDSLRLDIMVIPRRDDYFNRCKSNLKFLEASALRVPCIVQGFRDMLSPYQVDLEDGQYMKIIVDNQDWLPAIDELVKDKEKRRLMGDKAHDYVFKKYSIEANIWRWEKAYKSLLDAQQTPYNSSSEVNK